MKFFRRTAIKGKCVYVCVLCLCFMVPDGLAFTRDNLGVIELFRHGKVSRTEDRYELAMRSCVFVKIIDSQRERCLRLNKPGRYYVSELRRKIKANGFFDFFQCNLPALLNRLKSQIIIPAM